MHRRISGWRPTCTVTARRSASGAPAISTTGSPVCKMRPGQDGRGAFPPSERIDVLSLATRAPADHHCPATRWSLDDMTAVLRDHARARAMSRSTLWRVLDEADLKPHRCVYWLNSHDPGFDAKARDICALYVNALRFFQQGRLVICVDEKTGMQILQRKHPTQPAQPGQPEKREQEYIRHGVRVLIASFVVPTGQVLWHLGPTRTSEDFAAHLANVIRQLPAMSRYDWVIDNLNTHWSLEVCRLVAAWCDIPLVPKALHRGVQRRAFLSDPTHQHVFHFTPKHGSWLNQVELWLSVLARRFLKRGDFCSQGHSVFEFNTDESQCLRRLGSQPAASRRHVGMARPPQEPNSGIAERRHHLRDVATAHLRAVFIKRHIAYPMGLVLNLPMTSDKLQQPIGGGPLGA